MTAPSASPRAGAGRAGCPAVADAPRWHCRHSARLAPIAVALKRQAARSKARVSARANTSNARRASAARSAGAGKSAGVRVPVTTTGPARARRAHDGGRGDASTVRLATGQPGRAPRQSLPVRGRGSSFARRRSQGEIVAASGESRSGRRCGKAQGADRCPGNGPARIDRSARWRVQRRRVAAVAPRARPRGRTRVPRPEERDSARLWLSDGRARRLAGFLSPSPGAGADARSMSAVVTDVSPNGRAWQRRGHCC